MARTIAKDHTAKRLAILGAAAGVFAKRGFDRSSMTDLARTCGVSKALIYHYYDSKDALLFDIVHTHLGNLLTSLQALDPPGQDHEANLRRLVQTILSGYRDADWEHELQARAMASLPADQREILAGLQRQLVDIVAEALMAVRPEYFAHRPELLRPVTMSLFGMVNWFYMWHRPGKGISRSDYSDLATDIVLHGLAGLDPLARKS